MGAKVCPSTPSSASDAADVVGSTTFYSLAIIMSGAACIITCSISFFLIMMHATHFSIPKEQKQIIRVVFCLPVFAVISLLDCWLTEASKYIEPWRNLYEAFALACFFLLLCTYISPDADRRERYFEGHELQNHRGEILRNGHFAAFKRCWIGIFQFPVVTFILTIVEDISEAKGTFCKNSRSFHFVNAWVKVFTLISTAIAIISVLRFYRATKRDLAHHRPLFKLIGFKLIIFLTFIQKIIFTFAISSGSIKPTPTFTYNDLNTTLPNLLLALEIALIAILFPFAYPSSPYHKHSSAYPPNTTNTTTAYPSNNSTTTAMAVQSPAKDYAPLDAPPMTYRGGVLGVRAVGQALDVRDFFGCYARGLGMVVGGGR